MGLISKEEVLKRIEYHQSNKVINRIKTTYAFELLKSDIEEIEEIVETSSKVPMTTLSIPLSIIASVQGGVLP